MANELQITALMAFTKAPAAVVSVGQPTVRQFNVAGTRYVHGIVNVGLAAEAIPLGDVATPGWLFIKNLDAANHIELLDSVAGAVFGKVKAGEPFMGRLGCAAPAWKANIAACNVEYIIVED